MRHPDRGQCAAAIAAQPHMHAHARRALFEGQKASRDFVPGGQRRQYHLFQIRDARVLGAHWQRPGLQPHRQKRRLLQRARELPVSQGQRHGGRFFRWRRLHKPQARLQ